MIDREKNKYISFTEYCNYSQEYLSLRARRGKLKAAKFGRNWVTTKEWLEEYLNNNSKLKVRAQTVKKITKSEFKKQGFRYTLRYSLVVVLIFFFLSFLIPATLIINKDIWRTVSGAFITNQEQVLKTFSHIGNSIHQISFLAESQDILKADINVFQQFGDWYHDQTVLLGQKIAGLYDSIKSFFSPTETVIVEKEIINEETLREIEKLQLRIEEMEEQGLSQQEIIEEIKKITQAEPLKEVIKEIIVVDQSSLTQLKDLLNRMVQAESDIEALAVLSQQPKSGIRLPTSQRLSNLNVYNLTILGDDISTDTTTFNSTIASDLIPSVTNTYNLGSATNYWNSAYIDNIIVGSTNMGGTTSESFVLNTDHATADAEDIWLEFERGTITPNAKILWSNSLTGNTWFDFNFPIHLSDAGQISGPGAAGLTLTNDSGDLTVSTTTSGDLVLTSAGNITETMASAGTYTLTDATTNFLAVDTNGAIAMTPTAGQDLSVNLATTGDFVVNTNQFFVDTSESKIGIGTNAPSEKLHLQDGTLLVDKPANPTLVGYYDTTSGGKGVYISGKYAYIGDSNAGVRIIDISNSSSPVLISTYDTTGQVQDVYVSGKYLYVADGASGLQIIDVSNPSSPTLIGTYNTSGYAQGVYISGKYAYVADNDNLSIINVSDPSSPILAGSFNGFFGNAYDIYVSGKYAYMAGGAASVGLMIIDISNPSSPSLVGIYDDGSDCRGVYVSGKYAYLAYGILGVQIINISNPNSPSLVGSYVTANYAKDVYVSGKYAYVVGDSSSNGLEIIDVSNPSSPGLVATFDTGSGATKVYVSGRYTYVTDWADGLRIIDIKGADIHALAAGNISTDNLTVWGNTDVGNNLYVRSGLDVGPRGIYSQGPLDSYIKLTGATAGTEYGNRIILSDTGVVTADTDTTYGQKTEVTRTGATGGTINTYGQYVSVIGDTGGTSTATAGYFSATGADTNYGLIVENGYVGLGIATPTETLDVVGRIKASWVCGGDIAFAYKGSSVTYGTVSHNDECWLDRNLGASQVATAYNDSAAYGDLFQWGRLDDQHQTRTSNKTLTLSSADNPGHSNFIYGMSYPEDWRSPQNGNLWQGVSGINNPCPSGWRIPTQTEWDTERLSWSENNRAGAYASPLKLTVGGYRRLSDAALINVGSNGYYWSSTTYSTLAYYLLFYSSGASVGSKEKRAEGYSVRCIKDEPTSAVYTIFAADSITSPSGLNVISNNIALNSLGSLTEAIASGSTYDLKRGTEAILSVDANGAVFMTPTAGQDLSVNLATTGDFVVNTNDFFVDTSEGNIGIGLAAPGRHLDVLDATAATPQLRLTSDSDTYGEFYVDATGDLSIGLTDGSGGDDIIILDENVKICSGGSFGSVSCPSITLTGTGNLVIEGDVYAAGGYKNSFSFMYSDVADSQTDLVIDVLGLTGNTEYTLPYSGSVIGVSATSNADLTAGTVTVDPAINGTKTGLTTTLSDTYQYNSATQDVNTDTFSAGDRLTIKVTTDADVEPNTIDIVVTIVIEY